MKKVCSKQCQNCLVTADRIVSPEAAGEILKQCLEDDSFFVCHRATMGDLGEGNDQVMCKGFYDLTDRYQILERVGLIKWIDHPDDKKLPTWKELNIKTKK